MITMKFQSFMDISTKDGEMQIISISAGGKNLLDRCPAQFGAYKYYKIGNISVKLVPASTLPVDPSGLSYEPGQNQVDPRDQLTPGMMRITNGEDILEDITGMSADEQHALYNAMMLDPRWYKWMLQSGVKRHATPRYWTIGQLHQDKWPGSAVNVPWANADSVLVGTAAERDFLRVNGESGTAGTAGNNPQQYTLGQSDGRGFFQTGHKGVLGWLPTDGMQWNPASNGYEPLLASPPEIEVMKILLPPAFATRYYYRAYITETVYFREPIVMSVGNPDFPYRPLDIFHYQGLPFPADPTDAHTETIPDSWTGGNDGSS